MELFMVQLDQKNVPKIWKPGIKVLIKHQGERDRELALAVHIGKVCAWVFLTKGTLDFRQVDESAS